MTTDTSGLTSRTPFAYYDPDSSCWRTSQGTFPWDSGTYSQTWPAWGMTQGGDSFELPTPAPPTAAPASSSLPTPTARDWKDGSPSDVPTNGLLGRTVWDLLPTPSANDTTGSEPQSQRQDRNAGGAMLRDLPTLLPTPNAFHMGNTESPQEWRQRRLDVFKRTGTRHGPALAVVAWSIQDGDPLTPDRYMPDEEE